MQTSPVDKSSSPGGGDPKPGAGGEAGATIVVDPPLASPKAGTSPKRVFAEDGQLELLFDPGLIPASMRDGLLEEYHVCCCNSGGAEYELTLVRYDHLPQTTYSEAISRCYRP